MMEKKDHFSKHYAITCLRTRTCTLYRQNLYKRPVQQWSCWSFVSKCIFWIKIHPNSDIPNDFCLEVFILINKHSVFSLEALQIVNWAIRVTACYSVFDLNDRTVCRCKTTTQIRLINRICEIHWLIYIKRTKNHSAELNSTAIEFTELSFTVYLFV